MGSVLIIVVTYNGMSWLPKSLDSALSQSVPVDIFVVDNLSTDGTKEYIKAKYKSIRLIEAAENLGFGKANNIGISHAKKHNYDYVFLLNQDVYLEFDTIEKLIRTHKLYPNFGVLSPLQYNGDKSALDKNFELNYKNSNNYYTVSQGFTDGLEPNATIKKVKFVMAAMWLVSRDCYSHVGYFDQLFYHYGEDNDYLNRVRFHNFDIGVVENAVGCHDRSYRIVSDLKMLQVTYAGYLAILTDLNSNLVVNYLKVFKRALLPIFKSIAQTDFYIAKESAIRLSHLVLMCKKVILSRKRNAKTHLV